MDPKSDQVETGSKVDEEPGGSKDIAAKSDSKNSKRSKSGKRHSKEGDDKSLVENKTIVLAPEGATRRKLKKLKKRKKRACIAHELQSNDQKSKSDLLSDDEKEMKNNGETSTSAKREKKKKKKRSKIPPIETTQNNLNNEAVDKPEAVDNEKPNGNGGSDDSLPYSGNSDSSLSLEECDLNKLMELCEKDPDGYIEDETGSILNSSDLEDVSFSDSEFCVIKRNSDRKKIDIDVF